MRKTFRVESKVPLFAAKMVVVQAPFCRKGGTQQVSSKKVVRKVGKFNICFRSERLTSHAGTVLLHDFARRLGVAQALDVDA